MLRRGKIKFCVSCHTASKTYVCTNCGSTNVFLLKPEKRRKSKVVKWIKNLK